jgi:hypothetical protein
MYIYLDESGDLGFNKEGSSKYIVISLLAVNDKKKIERRMKKIKRNALRKKYRKHAEFKKERQEVARAILRHLIKEEFELYTVIVNKSKVKQTLRKSKEILYNYIASIILLSCPFEFGERVKLIVDKRSSKRLILQNFENYLQEKIKALNKKILLTITHTESYSSPGIQAVDFVAWAILRKYQWQDFEFYNIIKEKIVTEKQLFF